MICSVLFVGVEKLMKLCIFVCSVVSVFFGCVSEFSVMIGMFGCVMCIVVIIVFVVV